jgi:hypothetical protein
MTSRRMTLGGTRAQHIEGLLAVDRDRDLEAVCTEEELERGSRIRVVLDRRMRCPRRSRCRRNERYANARAAVRS